MKLGIRNLEFGIESAKITWQINDSYRIKEYDPTERMVLFWMLEINGTAKEIMDCVWKPFVYHQNLKPLCSIAAIHCVEIKRQSLDTNHIS